LVILIVTHIKDARYEKPKAHYTSTWDILMEEIWIYNSTDEVSVGLP